MMGQQNAISGLRFKLVQPVNPGNQPVTVKIIPFRITRGSGREAVPCADHMCGGQSADDHISEPDPAVVQNGATCFTNVIEVRRGEHPLVISEGVEYRGNTETGFKKEKDIFISLLDKPLKRKEIANNMGVTTGSLSNSLKKLQKLDLITIENNLYTIKEKLLARWLKKEYETYGVYPYIIN